MNSKCCVQLCGFTSNLSPMIHVPDDSYRHKINLTAKQVRTIMEYLGDP